MEPDTQGQRVTTSPSGALAALRWTGMHEMFGFTHWRRMQSLSPSPARARCACVGEFAKREAMLP